MVPAAYLEGVGGAFGVPAASLEVTGFEGCPQRVSLSVLNVFCLLLVLVDPCSVFQGFSQHVFGGYSQHVCNGARSVLSAVKVLGLV